jgi:type II secretion system protein H
VSGRRAFTLIELMAVLAILACVTAMVTPAVRSGLRGADLRTAGGRVTDLLDFARLAAISRARPVSVHFDPARRLAWADRIEPALPWVEARERQTGPRVLARMQWPAEVQVVVTAGGALDAGAPAARDAVVFAADGTAQDAQVLLTDRAGRQLEVLVFGPTGEVRLRGIPGTGADSFGREASP